MIAHKAGALAAGCLVALVAAPAAYAQDGATERRLTVDDAVRMALSDNPRLRAAGERVRGSKDAALSVGAHALPSIALSEEYQHYDGPFAITFSIPGAPMGGGASFVARKQDTNTFVASAQQPLLGLGHIIEDYRAQRAAAGANEAAYRAAKAQVKEAIEAGFLRYFEALALEEIAKASEAQLAEQVKVSAAKVKAGVATTADLLRVQVAQSNARQQAIAARSQADVARASLLAAVGIAPSDRTVALVEPTTLLGDAEALPDAASAGDSADRLRPEIVQLRLTADSARHSKNARYLSILPELNVEGAYLRVDGQPFQPESSAYVGVKATWPIWEWGATFFGARAAGRQAAAALYEVEDERRQVAAEVEAGLSQSRAAASAVDVAHEAIGSAEEAFRVMQAQVSAGTATTTDLLAAQAELTNARANFARARYELAVQRVSLARVIGR